MKEIYRKEFVNKFPLWTWEPIQNAISNLPMNILWQHSYIHWHKFSIFTKQYDTGLGDDHSEKIHMGSEISLYLF